MNINQQLPQPPVVPLNGPQERPTSALTELWIEYDQALGEHQVFSTLRDFEFEEFEESATEHEYDRDAMDQTYPRLVETLVEDMMIGRIRENGAGRILDLLLDPGGRWSNTRFAQLFAETAVRLELIGPWMPPSDDSDSEVLSFSTSSDSTPYSPTSEAAHRIDSEQGFTCSDSDSDSDSDSSHDEV